jgi:membrane protease YdiL (CAAX protease family)
MVTEARSSGHGLLLTLEICIFAAVFCVAGLMIEGTIQTVLLLPALFDSPTLLALKEQAARGTLELSSASIQLILGEALSHPWVMLGMLYSTVGLSAGVLIFCRAIERRSFASMGLSRAHLLREYLLGALLGFVLLVAAVGLCVACGALQLEPGATFSIGFFAVVVAFFVGFVLQGFSEELLCRGYFLVSLARRQSLAVAVGVSSLAFAVLHLMNPGVLEQPLAIPNLFLFGAFAGIYLLKRGNIWGVAAVHSLWNFTQGTVFGIQVSGTSGLPSVFSARTPADVDATWAGIVNGGSFGLEGGLAVTAVLLVATVIILLLPSRRSA